MPKKHTLVAMCLGAALVGGGGIYATLHSPLWRGHTAMSAEDHAANQKLMAQAITLIRQHALQAGRIEWATQEPKLMALAAQGNRHQVHRAIHLLLRSLEDGHSFLMPPILQQTMTQKAVALPQARMVAPGIGVLTLPGLMTGNTETMTHYVHNALAAMTALPTVHAWVIDLRGNTGGTMWPMLTALQPFLGVGPLGYFSKANGSPPTPWHTKPDLYAPGTILPDWTALPVAVLQDARTASAAEATAIALKGRAATRFFGTPTHGQTTANRTFRLMDGSLLMVAASYEQDRTHKTYTGPLQPDVLTTNQTDPLPLAVAWLQALPPVPAPSAATTLPATEVGR
ncbi:peptidase S41 [Acetobacter cibinongensis]|uniref:Exported protease/peptidase n=1 Tax=Acetobacter cibinongensis TaxID=146475 RepID=A0A0D6N631_9PROT|nr:S41 family peptidase [Acetobacter cibinongensis]GAN61414.1 exported protease/peptidase [Acetobacter cibinongensis]GEL59680.1 peptidase S41 [Acetobacter cibinongensis]